MSSSGKSDPRPLETDTPKVGDACDAATACRFRFIIYVKGEEFPASGDDRAKGFPSLAAAYDEISRAYVAFGRDSAGLPTIEWKDMPGGGKRARGK